MTLAAPPNSPLNDAAPRYRTAADWWNALGDVPLNRIIFDPRPGTATEADVIRLDNQENRLCELIEGTLVEKAMGYEESLIALRIGHLLLAFVDPRKLGLVSGADGMMKILRRRVRIPDVAFVSKSRLPDGKSPKEAIPQLVPDLAVEVLSDSNTEREMTNKLTEYFQAGTRLVWYVNHRAGTIDVYTSATSSTRLTESDVLRGGDVLPGFEVPVREIFKVG